MNTLDLGLIGNSSIGALINPLAEIVWACLPRFDGNPVFCSLLRERRGELNSDFGFFAINLIDGTRNEQEYLTNTAIMITRLYDSQGCAVEVTDFAPRFYQYGRVFHPMMLIRRIRRLSGSPRVCLRIRPACDYGAHRPTVTNGSHHIRYVAADFVLRLTTDASITAILEETPFYLEDELTLIIGPDEPIHDAVGAVGDRFQRETTTYWRRHADRIHQYISERSWNPRLNSFVATLDGNGKLDASLLLLHEIGFLRAEDPRFVGTVAAIERELRHGDFIFRYAEADDFGVPENAFLVCTFWYIYALAALGRCEEARVLFEKLLARRNLHGLLAEHIDPRTGEQWGNFPQTYSMVWLINSAIRLSIRWDQEL